jgi:S1-C subfamily serine protease
LLALAALVVALAPAAAHRADAAEAGPAAVENSVVKIFSTLRLPDALKPWTKQAPQQVSASGVVIEGERILTNAHVVQYASQVQVQANGSGDKLAATVLAVAPGMDLAVLKLEDASFFKSHAALRRAAQLPLIKDPVLAYGFPMGGSSLSITKGIVSRIEFVPFNLSVSGLRIQIDAAINPGNSGGPAIAGDRMIGLAFSKLGGGAENIGYIIPNEEVELFLKDIADGHYDGKPAIYDELQTLENPALRAYLKLDKSVEGMVVHRPFKADDSYPLKEWDVVTHIGATPIDNQGQVEIGKDLRVGFEYLVQRVAKNGTVPLTVVRAGKTLNVQVPVLTERPMLVRDLQGQYPSYFILGPLSFSTASFQMLGSLKGGTNGFARSKAFLQWFDPPTPEREEIVFVSSPFFPHKLAAGYDNPAGAVIDAVNGVHIRSLKHLVAVLRDLKDPYVTIEFDQRGGEALVFERQAMVAATEEILNDNGVRAQGSADTLEVWSKSGN